MQIRPIRKIVTGTTQYDGAGVKLVRVISHPDTEDFDPFLMLDAFDSTNPADYEKGFPWHPHRGIETVTYLVSGIIEHEDSLGNKGTITDGCCQWMTAGSGIMHQEMPRASEHMLGVQLWLNLPARFKMTSPEYRDIRSGNVPVTQEEGVAVRILTGSLSGRDGAVRGEFVPMTFLDVSMDPGSYWECSAPAEFTVFAYIMTGEGWFSKEEDERIYMRRAILFGDGNKVYAHASDKGMRLLIFMGPPQKEPIAWGGPIVMNTRQELDQAFRELQSGTFIK